MLALNLLTTSLITSCPERTPACRRSGAGDAWPVPNTLLRAWVGPSCPEPLDYITLVVAVLQLRPSRIVYYVTDEWPSGPARYHRWATRYKPGIGGDGFTQRRRTSPCGYTPRAPRMCMTRSSRTISSALSRRSGARFLSWKPILPFSAQHWRTRKTGGLPPSDPRQA